MNNEKQLDKSHTHQFGLLMDIAVLKQWCGQELTKLLQFTVEDELVSYLISMRSESDIEEYVKSLLGKQYQGFLREYLVRWRSLIKEKHGGENEDIMFPLRRPRQDELILFAEKKGKTKAKESKVNIGKGVPPGFSSNHIHNTTSSTFPKHKTKFVPLMSCEGQHKMSIHVPGRHVCQCVGQKHHLINNCLECGRIVCSQEGSGPCLFCGAVVFTKEEEQVLSRDSRRAEKIKEKMWQQYNIKGVEPVLSLHQINSEAMEFVKASEHKDKLLEYDRTSISRTKVMDDESDYFTVDNRWLSEEERAALQKREDSLREQRYGNHCSVKVTLDFAGRKVVEEDNKLDIYTEENVKDLVTKPNKISTSHYEILQSSMYNPSILIPPQNHMTHHKMSDRSPTSYQPIRLQDRTILEMRDEGKCLSLHQPWASLVVYGIKRFEGRTWYTHNRGKLWIASTGKKPESETIQQLERFYSQLYQDHSIIFPEEYPSGCLLGCVDLVDCLSQEEYQEKFPDGESESDYVFVFRNPQHLKYKFQIKGKHKIWQLPYDVHLAAKRGCREHTNSQHKFNYV